MTLDGRHNRGLLVPTVIFLGVLVGCGGQSPTGSSPATTVAANSPTPTPTPPPTPTPTAPPTPTPPPACSISLSSATFEPQRVSCPAGTSRQTVRVVFDATAGGGVDVTINKVSSASVTCAISRGTCTWPEGSLSFSPSVVPAGTRVQIVATETFNCTAGGTGSNLGELVYGALYVNTSCGASQELKLTNTLSIG